MSKNLNERQDNEHVFAPSWAEAARALMTADELWKKRFPECDFIETIVQPIRDDKDLTGELYVDLLEKVQSDEHADIAEIENGGLGKATFVKFALFHTVAAYATQSLEAETDSKEAWSYAAHANRWVGVLQGLLTDLGDRSARVASEMGKRGADAAHVENRAMKAQVMEWLDRNRKAYGSLEDVADAVAGKVVPVKRRTVRDWITEWNKKIQSSGKP